MPYHDVFFLKISNQSFTQPHSWGTKCAVASSGRLCVRPSAADRYRGVQIKHTAQWLRFSRRNVSCTTEMDQKDVVPFISSLGQFHICTAICRLITSNYNVLLMDMRLSSSGFVVMEKNLQSYNFRDLKKFRLFISLFMLCLELIISSWRNLVTRETNVIKDVSSVCLSSMKARILSFFLSKYFISVNPFVSHETCRIIVYVELF